MSLTVLFLVAAFGIFSASAEVMFKADATVRVANGYYNATIYYLYKDSSTGKTYLRYDYTNPTTMIDLIDYSDGKRYKVCTKCESGFFAYSAPALLKQSTDVATGRSEGQCKEYIPKDTSGLFSIWYKDDGTICKAALADGKTLILSNVKSFSDKSYFNLEGKQCPAPVCKRVMDLVFVLDKSGSICGGNSGKYLDRNGCDLGNWIQIQDFVVSIVESFDVGADATMIGIVTFSNGATQVSALSANKDSIINAMRNAKLTRYITCTGCGIDMAMDILKSTTSARTALDPEKVMIVMTDGESNYHYNNPCAAYKPVCTKNTSKCVRWECPGGYQEGSGSVCTKYEETTTCKKYKCDTCKNNAWGSCTKTTCTKTNTSNCIRYSSKCQTAYPNINKYCGVSNGVVVNKDISTVYCMCGTYQCAEYQCLQSQCDAYECSDCEQYSTSVCVEYEKKCVERSSTGTCPGGEVCMKYECLEGTIQCIDNIRNEYAMITGAINRTRTQWALYPASKRLPIVMVIGVTRWIDMNELRAIASTLEGKSLVYNVTTFNDLKTIISDLVDETCVSQTENLELCDDKCLGFCGCEKKCYCPTCDASDGECYSISCSTDLLGLTSKGCVVDHKVCTSDNQCLVISRDNNTEGCCVETEKNCVESTSKCVIYGCDPKTGCTKSNVVCVPSSSCFVSTCDPAVGCVETPVCPDNDPCKIMSCKANGNDHECLYEDKCKSNDGCMLPVCDNVTGACSLKPKECPLSSPCNVASCFQGNCSESENITKKIMCASATDDPCMEGFCNETTGDCDTRPIKIAGDTCENCGQNKSLECSKKTDECFIVRCDAGDVDGSKYPTKCVYDDICHSDDPCITKKCENGKCVEGTPCPKPKDACETVMCIADPQNTLGYRCEASTTVPEDDACWSYTCNSTTGSADRESTCTSKCGRLLDCEVVDGKAKCMYEPTHNCESNSCTISTCNDETGLCDVVDNSSDCNKFACKAYTCYNSSGCDYKEITCDDNNPCTIDLCLSYDEYSSSDSDAEYNSEDVTVELYTDEIDSLPHVCVHIPKCTTSKFCERASCDAFGKCSIIDYTCNDKKPNDTCHTYKCDEATRSCKYVLLDEVFLSVCGDCIGALTEEASGSVLSEIANNCVGGMKLPEFAATIGGAAVAGIVVAAVIVAAVIGVSSTIGTKELIKRAKKNADVGTNSNPLYEDNDNEAVNPAFVGEN